MTTAIIQARIGSTRLSGKVMLNILGKPVLWHVVNRVSKAKLIDELIVATTTKSEDNIIAEFCKKNEILFFRESESDVLDRYYQCAKEYNVKDIVRITSDCPLHDPNVIDIVVNEYLRGNYDYVSNTIEYTFPDGLDVEVFSFNVLENAWKNAELPSEREHVTPYIRKNEEFKKKNVYSSKKYPLYRLTLDYPEDYEFIKNIYEEIGEEMFFLEDIVEFLKKNQELLKINQHLKINEGYVKSLKDDTKDMEKVHYKVSETKGTEYSIIDGGRIYLRELKEDDASQGYCNWLNDPIINKFLETKKATIEELKQYIKEKKENPNCLFFGFFLKDTDKHIGNIKLEPINFENKEATLGILIGDKNYWGRGVCTEAVKLLAEHAFKNLNLEKINLGVNSENKAAIKCYLKAGFRINKIEQRAIKYNNRFYDKVIMNIEKQAMKRENMAVKINKGIELWNKAKKIIPGGSQLLSKRSEQFLPEQWPSYYKKAKGVEVWDLDDNKYIDMSLMGVGTCILGYADDDVNEAVKKIVGLGTMTTLNCPEEVELAELLLNLHHWADMVRYAKTGGEAMAIAVRIARAYTGKDKVAFCGYHGWHDWYLSANLADDKNLDGHLLPGLKPLGVPRGLKGTAIPFNYNRIEELEEIVKSNDIGVIVTEPIRHHKPENNFLKKVRKIAEEIGAVLIFDEISSGWRMNVGGAHELYKVYPDIAVYGKAMSNGFPMTAIVGKEKVMDIAQESFISSTYWTERIGAVAAIATISKMSENNVPAHLCKIGDLINKGWRNLAKEHDLNIDIMDAVPSLTTFVFDYEADSQSLHTLFTQEMLERGFLASKSVYVSYSHNEEHIEEYFDNVDEVFGIIKEAIEKDNVYDLLKGPVAHEGFKRLT